jgi:flagellar assembly protein FliH
MSSWGAVVKGVDGEGFGFSQLEPPPQAAPTRDIEPRSLLAAAEHEAERIRASARDQGFREGYAAGQQAAAEELEPAARSLLEATERVRAAADGIAEHVEAQAARLALAIAEKVVAASIELEPERVVDVIRGALRAVVERERIVIGVNPADLDLVRSATDDLCASLGGIEYIEVQEERRVDRGGVVVRTQVGEIDARIRTKLDRAAALLGAERAS